MNLKRLAAGFCAAALAFVLAACDGSTLTSEYPRFNPATDKQLESLQTTPQLQELGKLSTDYQFHAVAMIRQDVKDGPMYVTVWPCKPCDPMQFEDRTQRNRYPGFTFQIEASDKPFEDPIKLKLGTGYAIEFWSKEGYKTCTTDQSFFSIENLTTTRSVALDLANAKWKTTKVGDHTWACKN